MLGAHPEIATTGEALLKAAESVPATGTTHPLIQAFNKVLPEMVLMGKAFFSTFKVASPALPGQKIEVKELLSDPNLPQEFKDFLQINDLSVEHLTNLMSESIDKGIEPDDVLRDYTEMVDKIAAGGRPDKCFIRFKNQQIARQFCLKNNCTARSLAFAVEKAKPIEIHHGIPHHHGKYTPEYINRLEEKGINLNLDDNWNKIKIPHRGPHPGQYHQWIINKLESILERVDYGDVDKFLDLYNTEVIEVIKADFIICSSRGYQ